MKGLDLYLESRQMKWLQSDELMVDLGVKSSDLRCLTGLVDKSTDVDEGLTLRIDFNDRFRVGERMGRRLCASIDIKCSPITKSPTL
ncbi:hypothetical protein U1Q18_044023 [Sarracenia purpurea var. burkii]